MTRDEANARIVKSRHTLGIYERNGLPGGPVDGAMAMLREEIEILESIARDHPSMAGKVAGVIERWEAIAAGLKRKAH